MNDNRRTKQSDVSSSGDAEKPGDTGTVKRWVDWLLGKLQSGMRSYRLATDDDADAVLPPSAQGSAESSRANKTDSISTGDAGQKKENNFWRLVGLVILLAVTTGIQLYVRDTKIPMPIPSNVAVIVLFNFNVILLITLIVLVFRNLAKLRIAKRERILGHKFQSKLILSFVALTLIPSVLLFLVASGLLTNSIDNWFNDQVETSLRKSLEVAQELYRESEQETLIQARSVADTIADKQMLSDENRMFLRNTLLRRKTEYGAIAIKIFDWELNQLESVQTDGQELGFPVDDDVNRIRARLMANQTLTEVRQIDGKNIVISVVPVTNHAGGNRAVVMIAKNISLALVDRVNAVAEGFKEYRQLKHLKDPIKFSYEITLLLITLVIVFSAIWFGFFLAKGITGPVRRLAEANKRVSEGDLDVKLESTGTDDELGILIESFNKMTTELKLGKVDLERAYKYIQTVLQSVAAGVIAIDRWGRIGAFNRSAAQILETDPERMTGRHYREVFTQEQVEAVREMIRELSRSGEPTVERKLQLKLGGKQLELLMHVSLLTAGTPEYVGLVIVFDDLTELIRAQKIAAWQEVARGIAHEVKNPLTPIQLNTERMRKKFAEGSPDFGTIFLESTKVIIHEVEGLKRMLNEFSKFARMPIARPKPDDIRRVIDETLNLYENNTMDVRIVRRFDDKIGKIDIDAEQIRRVVINLMDNAIDASEHGGSIEVSAYANRDRGVVTVEFADTGRGVPAEIAGRLFEPYVSTKKKGTGLGLAIVSRIVADHRGKISMQPNKPRGSVFTVELPMPHHLAQQHQPEASATAEEAIAPTAQHTGSKKEQKTADIGANINGNGL